MAIDNRGVGASSSTTPDTIEAMAKHAIAFMEALGLTKVDLLGFSMGGFIAQVIAHDRPALVRRLILAGTGPAGGESIGRVATGSGPFAAVPAVVKSYVTAPLIAGVVQVRVRRHLDSVTPRGVLAKAAFTGPIIPSRIDVAVGRDLYPNALTVAIREAAIALPIVACAGEMCIGRHFHGLAIARGRFEPAITLPSCPERGIHRMGVLGDGDRHAAAICLSEAALTTPTGAVSIVEVCVRG